MHLGRRIPKEIKYKVLNQWLYGIPTNMIPTCNGIGYGSVYRIIESSKSKIPDLDVFRAVAVKMYKDGLSLSDVASGIRIKNFLLQMGSSEIEMERLLTEIDIHSLKQTKLFQILLIKYMKFIDLHRDMEFLFTK